MARKMDIKGKFMHNSITNKSVASFCNYGRLHRTTHEVVEYIAIKRDFHWRRYSGNTLNGSKVKLVWKDASNGCFFYEMCLSFT